MDSYKGWDEIALFFDTSPRTARRWGAEGRGPFRRRMIVQRANDGSVSATPAMLGKWLESVADDKAEAKLMGAAEVERRALEEDRMHQRRMEIWALRQEQEAELEAEHQAHLAAEATEADAALAYFIRRKHMESQTEWNGDYGPEQLTGTAAELAGTYGIASIEDPLDGLRVDDE